MLPRTFVPGRSAYWWKRAEEEGDLPELFRHPSLSFAALKPLQYQRLHDNLSLHMNARGDNPLALAVSENPQMLGWLLDADLGPRTREVVRGLALLQLDLCLGRADRAPFGGDEYLLLRRFLHLLGAPYRLDDAPGFGPRYAASAHTDSYQREWNDWIVARPGQIEGWNLRRAALVYQITMRGLPRFLISLSDLPKDLMMCAARITGAARELLGRELAGLENPWKGAGL